MKKFTFLLTLCLCVLFCNAQIKRNQKGQKVVERIEIYYGENTEGFDIIVFDYDKLLNLKEIKFFTNDDIYVWEKEDNTIKRNKYKSTEYRYKIDNGLITYYKSYETGTDGSILTHRDEIIYNQENRIQQIKEKVGNDEEYCNILWDANNNKYREDRYMYDEENNTSFLICKYVSTFYTENENSIDKKKEELVNDTNIEFGYIYLYGEDNDIPLMTEWFGEHSYNLVETCLGKYFDYEFDNEYGGMDFDTNDRGNLITVKIISHKKIYKTYKIYYLK